MPDLNEGNLNIFPNELFQNETGALSCGEGAKKSPSERELEITELSFCSLDLLSTKYTNSIIPWVKF